MSHEGHVVYYACTEFHFLQKLFVEDMTQDTDVWVSGGRQREREGVR